MSKVYWSYCHPSYQIRAEEPVSVFQNYFKDKDIVNAGLDYVRCPAFKDILQNTFGLKSLFDYELSWDGDKLISSMHDQAFFDKMTRLRNANSRFASFNSKYVFIAEDDSLEMEFLPSMMENNSFNKSCILIPATLDIGKYMRTQECAFHCREKKMEIKEGDIFAYVKFKTDRNIEFQRFLWNDDIDKSISNDESGVKHYRTPNFKPLKWYYKKQRVLKTKQRAIEIIKENLL